MMKLFPLIYIMAFTTLAGSAIVGLLAADYFDGGMILWAVAGSAVVAAIASWIISKKILALNGDRTG